MTLAVWLSFLLAISVGVAIGLACGFRLGKDSTKRDVLMQIDATLDAERLVSLHAGLSHEQRNKGLLENLKQIRKRVNDL